MILAKLKKKLRRRKAKEINVLTLDERRKERMGYLENKFASLKQRTWTSRTFYLAQVTNFELFQLGEKLGLKTDKEIS